MSALFGGLGRVKARSARWLRKGRGRHGRSAVLDARVALVRARQAQLQREKIP